eukprot:3610784-Rhodomonas_salina.1
MLCPESVPRCCVPNLYPDFVSRIYPVPNLGSSTNGQYCARTEGQYCAREAVLIGSTDGVEGQYCAREAVLLGSTDGVKHTKRQYCAREAVLIGSTGDGRFLRYRTQHPGNPE